MGQAQSQDSETAPSDIETNKQDYYELLGVERQATDDEIKKAYRKRALELHPDRNYGNVEDATRLFAEVQSAYEVLSDPQERAWYDSHRDVLLRGDGGGQNFGVDFSYNIKMTTTEEVLKLMMKFNGRLEFNDAPGGFYGGLHEFFQKLAKEEDIAAQWEGLDVPEYPVFGTSNDDYDQVVRPFYAVWNGFATKKSYAWKDQYRLSDAPDRRIRRLMEKENRKLRDEAVQEFNDAVRSLLAFVRKRDPRVKNNQKSEAERQKALRDAAAAQAARSRAARNAELDTYVVPDWAQSRTKDAHEGEFSSESEVEEHEYDCVACDKTFKSEAQYKAHERSKKHVKLLKQLQRDMRTEGRKFDLPSRDDGSVLEDDEADTEAPTVPRVLVEDRQDLQAHKVINGTNGGLVGSDSASISGSEEGNFHLTSNVHEVQSRSDKPMPRRENRTGESTDNEDEDEDYAPRSDVAARLAGSQAAVSSSEDLSSTLASTTLGDKAAADHLAEASGSDTQPAEVPPSRIGKAKLKRAKKAAAQQSDRSGGASSEFSCQVCRAEFNSKTQLFKHIKEKGHAALKSDSMGTGTQGGKAKKRQH